MARRIGKLGTNKKGSALDLILIAAGLLVFAMVSLIGYKIVSEFETQIAAQPLMPTEAIASTAEMKGHFTGVVDNSILFLVMGLAIGSFILASMVRIHPIFIPLYIILLVFIIFFCGIYSNIYQGMAETAQLSTEAAELTTITHVLTYLPLIVGIIGIILMIVMYKLWSNAQMMD